MAKYYCIIPNAEITDEMLFQLGTNKSKPVRILFNEGDDDNEKASAFSIVSTERLYINSLNGYTKYTKSEVDAAIIEIQTKGYTNYYNHKPINQSAFPSNEGRRARFKGGFKMTIPAGETVSQEFIITEDKDITGGNYKGYNTNFGDNVDIEVTHPVAGTLDKFVEAWYVSDDLEQLTIYPARVPAGLKLKLTYYNVGVSEAKIFINLFLHKV